MRRIRFYPAVFCLFVILSPVGAISQTYEVGLRKAAEALSSSIESAGQKSVTVLDLTDLQGATTELGRFLAQELSDQLVAITRQVAVVDRANMQFLLREKNLSAEGFVNPESSKKIGNLIGIDTVILGSITPLGQNIRMSLRAIALETGKVVASQSVSLPITGDLSALYNRGVSATPAPSGASREAQSVDPRTRFRGDSIKFRGKEVVVYECGSGGGACNVTAQFSIENMSGVGFGTAISAGATSIGPCVEPETSSSGLSLLRKDELNQASKQENPDRTIGKYFPTGGKLDGAVTFLFSRCAFSALKGVRTADISLTIVVALASGIFTIPISAADVPVRWAGQR
jgi:curli biogenesis system outer membrane secretion channel CsgG